MKLDGPQTLVLTPESVAKVLDVLADKPYKEVVVVIQEIVRQLNQPPSEA